MNTNTQVRQLILPGNTFAKLTVVSYAGQNKHKAHLWNCRCECGGETVVKSTNLRTGHTKSCGCIPTGPKDGHGHTRGGKITPEYCAWKNMRSRCYQTSYSDFKHYGGRGITVCERWRNSFESFFEDMGTKPAEFTLERIDTNGNYQADNCKWAAQIDQANNTRRNVHATIDGRRQTVMQWIKEKSLPVATIYVRIRRGMSPEEAILIPILDKKSHPRGSHGQFLKRT